MHAPLRHQTQYKQQEQQIICRPNRGDACSGFPPRPHQSTIPRGGQSPASLALNRQARPVNARSTPVRATAALAVGGNGGGRSLVLPKGALRVGGAAGSGPSSCNPCPGSPGPGGRGGRVGARPTVRTMYTAATVW